MEEVTEQVDLKEVVVIDLKTVPVGWDVQKVLYVMKTQGILVIDSHSGGVKPFMLHSARELQFKDIKDYKEDE